MSSREKNGKSRKKQRKAKKVKWTELEDKILLEKGKEYNCKNWRKIASFLPGHSSIQCSSRYKRIQPNIVKGSWSKEEDEKLINLYNKYGKNWCNISKEMPWRTGKQIRDRYLNVLDSRLNKNKFSEEEDNKIIELYKKFGNSWSKIAKYLIGRTGDMVKNRFYSTLGKIILNKENQNNNEDNFLGKKHLNNHLKNQKELNENHKSEQIFSSFYLPIQNFYVNKMNELFFNDYNNIKNYNPFINSYDNGLFYNYLPYFNINANYPIYFNNNF